LRFGGGTFNMSGVERRRRLLLHGVLGLPLVLVAGVAGFAWDRWTGVVLAVVAVVALQVLVRLGGHLRATGTGHAASTLPIAILAAIVGYVILGVFGLIFMGVMTWIPAWLGSRGGERGIRRDDAAREERLSRTHRHGT
jgi:hypothetical protein